MQTILVNLRFNFKHFFEVGNFGIWSRQIFCHTSPLIFGSIGPAYCFRVYVICVQLKNTKNKSVNNRMTNAKY